MPFGIHLKEPSMYVFILFLKNRALGHSPLVLGKFDVASWDVFLSKYLAVRHTFDELPTVDALSILPTATKRKGSINFVVLLFVLHVFVCLTVSLAILRVVLSRLSLST